MNIDLKTRAPLRATYRVQLNARFGFEHAAQIAPYLQALGISHLYCSPYLQAAKGSTHGYDVVDYHQVNRELGGEKGLQALDKALRASKLGQVLDMVPNHMAIGGPENPWWWDVLEHGPSSRYAGYFDVEWNPTESRRANVVLVPTLGDHYGRVLNNGEIKVQYDGRGFTVAYFENVYPVDPRSVSLILASAAEQLESPDAVSRVSFLADAFNRLPNASAADRESARRRWQDSKVLLSLLEREITEHHAVKTAVQQAVEKINADPEQLDIFLELQNYRLAFWRIARSELGYRRFFDINTMAGLRMEDELVYLDTHARVLNWLKDGTLDGLRVDHPDGLRDPLGYFTRLRAAAPNQWIVIEKIVEMDEHMPGEWPVQGTTGYDFLNRVNGLFVDPEAEDAFTSFYREFTGLTESYENLVYQNKVMAAQELLGPDLEHLADLFQQICENHRVYRDYTRPELRGAITATTACLPVYRTYARPEDGTISAEDQEILAAAVRAARQKREDLDPALFDFLLDLLTLKVRGERESELVMRFQQFTGPVMAKGVEDTTFYLYNRLISLNEVGGNPGQFGFSASEFHAACAETLEKWPYALLATSTHDTKRSEDVRARLNALTEIPERWREAVLRWAGSNERYHRRNESNGPVIPDRNTEYLIYQTIVGAWPLEEERLLQYMEKAGCEARVHTSWRDPNPEYEEAVAGFIHDIYADERFIKDLSAFVETIIECGRSNSLAQTLLKLTTPGVPDIYQGTELWDLSLVDPDNRRPVDYDLRCQLFESLPDQPDPEGVCARIDEGLPKLWVIKQALALRKRQPACFGPKGEYLRLEVSPSAVGDLAVAFSRGEKVAVVVPRLTSNTPSHASQCFVTLPPGDWKNLFSGEILHGGKTPLTGLLTRFPVALLEKIEEAGTP